MKEKLDIQKEYDEFESFMQNQSNLKFEEHHVHTRKLLGRYFDERDNYFQIWFAAKVFYSK